jgi:hypothetical protein
MPDYKVKQGDCISSISARHGLFWEKVWNHPKNAKLKEKRKDPNVLYPGDVVFIPEKEKKEESGATEQRHRFKKKGTPAKLKIRLLRKDQPRANLPYRLKIDGEWRSEGETDGDGFVEASIPPCAKTAEIHLETPGQSVEVYTFNLGGLDPIDTDDGIRERLSCLGFRVGDDMTRAIEAFQKKEGMNPTGQMDEATRTRLKERFGR